MMAKNTKRNRYSMLGTKAFVAPYVKRVFPPSEPYPIRKIREFSINNKINNNVAWLKKHDVILHGQIEFFRFSGM